MGLFKPTPSLTLRVHQERQRPRLDARRTALQHLAAAERRERRAASEDLGGVEAPRDAEVTAYTFPGAADAQQQSAAAAAAQTVTSGHTVTGTSGADSFAMDISTIADSRSGPMPIAHVVGYSGADGDMFDFSKPHFAVPPTLPTAVIDADQLAACPSS